MYRFLVWTAVILTAPVGGGPLYPPVTAARMRARQRRYRRLKTSPRRRRHPHRPNRNRPDDRARLELSTGVAGELGQQAARGLLDEVEHELEAVAAAVVRIRHLDATEMRRVL